MLEQRLDHPVREPARDDVTDASAVAATIASEAYRHAVRPCKIEPTTAQTNSSKPTAPFVRAGR